MKAPALLAAVAALLAVGVSTTAQELSGTITGRLIDDLAGGPVADQ